MNSESLSHRTRIAVLVDDGMLDYRSAEVIRLLSAAAHTDLTWIGLTRPAEEPGSEKTQQGAMAQWLLRLDERVRRPYSRSTSNGARLDEAAPDVPVLMPADWPSMLRDPQVGSDDAEDHRPDLVVCLSTSIEPETLFRQGGVPVWWFCTDSGPAGGELEGVEPTLRATVVVRVKLIATIGPDPTHRMLGVSECRVHPTSPTMTKQEMMRGGVRVLADSLAALADTRGVNEFCERALDHPSDELPTSAPHLRFQDALLMVGRAISQSVVSRMRREGEAQWSIGLARRQDVDWKDGRVKVINWLAISDDRFVADPCLVQKDGRTWLFMEELRYSDHKGFIAVMDANDPASWGAAEPVLVAPHHLSFPNVFEVQGDYFMLPEALKSRRLVLYRSHAFPGDWRPHAVLLEGMDIADPVLLRHEGYWWLFFSWGEYKSFDNNTQLYYSTDLEGPYQRHPSSPVHQGLTGSRMAGAIFREGERLIRPAQDCRRHYGEAVIFKEILALTPESYEERRVGRIAPQDDWPFNRGTHSFSRSGSLVALDGFRLRRR